MNATPLHTAGNAVPPVDGTELGDVLDDLAGIHAGIDLHRDGIRHLALDRHDIDRTQTLIAALAGSPDCDLITAIGLTVQRLATAESNPALRSLPLDVQKTAQLLGERIAFALADPEIHNLAAELAAVIDQQGHGS
ncbi:hypothetical protein [Streptomyces sp. NPDC058297]|uniref:hypothetical protein n=1 Tax=Streptomyces sp. NPDC058297 TaxID=3346433 RepID=UPI0036EDF59E